MRLFGTAIRYLKIAAVPILISVTVMLNGCRGQSEESSETGETLRFVFLADSRGNALTDPINTPVLNAIIAQIKALSPQSAFVVFGGDIKPAYTFQTWKGLFAPLTSAGITLYTAIANHELYHEHAGLFLLESQMQFFVENLEVVRTPQAPSLRRFAFPLHPYSSAPAASGSSPDELSCCLWWSKN